MILQVGTGHNGIVGMMGLLCLPFWGEISHRTNGYVL